MNTPTTPTTPENPPKISGWALVELFGHQKIVGRISEQSMAGGCFLRVDVPTTDEQPAYTRFYGAGAIYSINPIDEEVALRMLQLVRNVPVEPYQIPQLADKLARAVPETADPEDQNEPPY